MKRIGVLLVALLLTGCAQFPAHEYSVWPQPSLTAPNAQPQLPQRQSAAENPLSPPANSTAPTEPAANPCQPSDPAVVAACLRDPWGLAVLPDGVSALVSERTTGRILLVGFERRPQEIARITDFDATDGGGVLGLAIGPAFDSDGLIFAYVSTATDDRIIRIARGIQRPIVTGLPRAKTSDTAPKGTRPGGALRFGQDGKLYAATASGTVLRLNIFGEPASAGPSTNGEPVIARGLNSITGLCQLPGGQLAALEQVDGQSVLQALPLDAKPPTPLFRFAASDGGAVSCASSSHQLGVTSLSRQRVLALGLSTSGAFTGNPQPLVEGQYGRLLTIDVGRLPDGKAAFWATTANRDGQGSPVPADDRVIVIATAASGGEGGPQ